MKWAIQSLHKGEIKSGLELSHEFEDTFTDLNTGEARLDFPFIFQVNKNGKQFGFPICVSVNDEIVHTRPTEKLFQNGDLIKVDIGLGYNGWYADMARTVIYNAANSTPPKSTMDIWEAGKIALAAGIEAIKPGNTTDDIATAIFTVARLKGYDTVTDFGGHGIGQQLHEAPLIPNKPNLGSRVVLRPGMVICLEPMLTQGSARTVTAQDGWKVWTADGGLAVHEEDQVLVTEEGYQILTKE